VNWTRSHPIQTISLGVVFLALLFAGCTPSPLFRDNRSISSTTRPDRPPSTEIELKENGNTLTGFASYYGPKFVGRPTANGEIFDPRQMTAAHRTLPFDTMLRVTLVSTGKSVVVRINDRGPFVNDRIIDLSEGAAEKIGLKEMGVGFVHAEILTADGE
jgi:peptidoglycan lytic transglycosylase